MKVLITGGAGFLGTHVAEYFRNKGDEVVAVDNLARLELERTKYNIKASREHNLNFLKRIGAKFIKRDIRNIFLKSNWNDVDFIIHCAAQPAMTIAIEEPQYDLTNNILGTENMLELARKIDVPFVNCSSIHIYGNNINKNLKEEETRFVSEPEMIDEKFPILNGDLTPLHVSKRAGELYTQSFFETYGLRTASFRLTGMYGLRQFGGMDHGWVANFTIRTVLERPITVFDTDKQVRDILYASDAARAFDLWYEKGKSEIYNIGGGMENSISLKECLELLARITGKRQNITFEKNRFGDLYYFVCDISKSKKHFNWEPLVSNIDGLKDLVKWVEENKKVF